MSTKSADQKHCFSCGIIIHHSALACPECGATQPVNEYSLLSNQNQDFNLGQERPTPLAATLMPNHVFCRGCGQQIHETASACPKCGAPQRTTTSNTFQNPSGGRTKVAAALFAFLLGGIGGHKFYLGSTGLGILYLVFCWTFIPAMIAFIEGIIYLTMSDIDFDRKYN